MTTDTDTEIATTPLVDAGELTIPRLNLEDLNEVSDTELVVAGTTYKYIRWAGVGILRRAALKRAFDRIDALEVIEAPTPADEEEYDAITKATLREIVVDIPREVVDAMGMEGREQALGFFLACRRLRKEELKERQVRAATPAAMAIVTAQRGRSIGATSSPDSTASGRDTTR